MKYIIDYMKNSRLLIILPLIYVVIFLIVPLVLITMTSFFKYDSMKLMTYEFTTANYKRFFSPYYLKTFLFTFEISALVVFFDFILGYPIANLIARMKSKWKGFFIFLVLTPLMVSGVIRAFGWIVILGKKGVLNSILLFLGIINEPIRILFTPVAVVIGLAQVFLPFMILPIMASIESIDYSYVEAARTLGARSFSVFKRILLPLSLPGVLSGGFLVFSLSMAAVVTPLLLGGAQNETSGILIYDQILGVYNWPFGSAVAIILAVFILFIILFALRKGGSVKR